MPQALAAIGTAGTWLGGSTWAAAAARLAIQVGLAYGAQQYQARQVHDTPLQSREVLIRSGASPKSIVIGKAWVAGVVAYSNARPVPPTHDNFELFLQTVHAGHRCYDITELMFDDVRITADQIVWDDWVYGVSSGPGPLHTYGHVSGGRYFFDSGVGVFAVHLEKHMNGERSPMLEAAGFNGDITPAHYMTGNCTTVVRFVGWSKTLTLYDAGPPTLVRALVWGAFLYDPRLDSGNGGSGAVLLADQSTWTWSDNPILAICWYLMEIIGTDPNDIDWPTVIVEANVCDELVALPNGQTEKRYTCNGQLTTGQTDRENLSAILSSCLGTLNQVAGKWRPLAGCYHAPDVTIDQTDIQGDVQVTTAVSRSERYNTVAGRYFTLADTAQQVDFVPVSDTQFLTRDRGVELRKTIDLPMTNSETMCQRIAFKLLQQSNNMTTLTLPMRWTGLRLTPGTGAQVTLPDLGLSSAVYRTIGVKIGDGGAPIVAVMHEDSATSWIDPTPAQYATRAVNGTISAAVQTIPGPINLAAIGVTGAIKVTWTKPILGIDSIRIYASPTPLVTTATLIYDGVGTSYTYPTSTRQYFWGVGVKNGIEGDFVPAIAGLTNIQLYPVPTGNVIRLRPPSSATTNVTAAPIIQPPLVNMMPLGLSDFETIDGVGLLVSGSVGVTAVLSTEQAWLGTKSIKCTPPVGSDQVLQIDFMTSLTNNIILRPNRRYIGVISVYLSTAEALTGSTFVEMTLLQYATTFVIAQSATPKNWANKGAVVGAWTRMAFEMDARNTANGSFQAGYLDLSWRQTSAAPSSIYIDGLCLFDVTEMPEITEDNFPYQFIGASGSTASAIGLDIGAKILSGTGSPEAVVTAKVGSVFLRSDGGASTTLYVKTSGTGSAGWTAK
jgi:hypothetical protein